MNSIASKEASFSKSDLTQRKLIDAGIKLFSENGYESTSTRQVQSAAGVQRNLISYHFGSKDAFWKACVAELFKRLDQTMSPAVSQSEDIEPKERIRFLIRRYLRASAAHPEITRIMFDEGRCNDWRLEWIVDNYGRGFYKTVQQLHAVGKKRGKIPNLTVTQFYYALVSSATVFAMAPECRLLTGEDPFNAEFVDAQADAVAALLTKPD